MHLLYNNSCAARSGLTVRTIKVFYCYILAEQQFGLRRNTQEAEEAPLLRV